MEVELYMEASPSTNSKEQDMKKEFLQWAKAQKHKNGQTYTDKTMNTYSHTLFSSSKKLKDVHLENTNIYIINDYNEFVRVKDLICNSEDFEKVNKQETGAFSAALNLYEQFLKEKKENLTEEASFGDSETINDKVNYWWLTAKPKIWDFESIEVGKVVEYTSTNETGNKRRIYKNFLDARVGDVVVGYEATPVKAIVALCKISQAHDGKEIKFQKIENLTAPIDYATLREIPELKNMEFFRSMNGSLFKLTDQEYSTIIDLIRDENPVRSSVSNETYTKADFLSDVFIDSDTYDTLTELLKRKMNLVLQGAPGVGKTYAAKRLAYSIMGEKDDSRVQMVQFHQSYSYEDFIMGYRPDPEGEGFNLKKGVFYSFCEQARNQPDQEFFFIIDEINRGNLSKIFGELLMLIESDKRGEKMTLTYSNRMFLVPENLYIIGMMNTADRSLAMIDYALRRRFCFFELDPAFGTTEFRNYLISKNVPEDLVTKIDSNLLTLNRKIEQDDSLGKGFRIGHSYFCDCEHTSSRWYEDIVRYEIGPLLDEYWFDEPDKAEEAVKELMG